jgi:hypothetical protein
VGYSNAPWASFGEALAAVAGALTGLLFVALSVNSDALAASRSLRARATQTLVLFMTSVLVAVLLVAPQPAAGLGAELLAVAVVSGTGLLILDRRAGRGSDQEVARHLPDRRRGQAPGEQRGGERLQVGLAGQPGI